MKTIAKFGFAALAVGTFLEVRCLAMLIRRTLQILSQNTGFRFLEPISKLEKTSK
jgi:hypothetical protein